MHLYDLWNILLIFHFSVHVMYIEVCIEGGGPSLLPQKLVWGEAVSFTTQLFGAWLMYSFVYKICCEMNLMNIMYKAGGGPTLAKSL